MTDLQTSLIIGGAVIIIAVIVYNKLQAYRAHRKVKRAFADAPDDVLMQLASTEDSDVRREPVLGGSAAAAAGSIADPDDDRGVESRQDSGTDDTDEVPHAERAEYADLTEIQASKSAAEEPYIDLGQGWTLPADNPASKKESDVSASALPARQMLPVDDLIDCSIPLILEEPVRAEKLLPLIQSLRYTGNKPVHFIGLIKDEKTGEESWQSVAHGGIYHQLKAGVQLANRVGALNEIEYSELITRLRQIADAVGAELEVPDMTDVLKVARGLHRFVAEHDARLGINVRTTGAPWSVKTLVAVLERQKFDLRPDGFFVMHDTDGSVLFSLVMNAPPASEMAARMTLLLDVPCVAQEKNGFGVMIQCAKSLCQRLNGVLVDDDDKMLSESMLNDIASQVNIFYEEMKAVSIPAGSVRAMRLFG